MDVTGKGLIHRSFLDKSISIFTSKRPSLFQEPSVSPDTVTFHSFLGTRKALFSHSLGFLSKAQFPDGEPPRLSTPVFLGFPGGSAGKESACHAGDLGLIPGLRRSPGEGKGSPLQYSGLENSTDRVVHGVAKSRTRLSDFHFATWISSFPYNRGTQFS